MITPKDESELATAVAEAQGPLRISGGDSRGLTGTGAQLSVAGLSGVSLYEPGALTMVAAAGTPVAEITAMLETERQQLAFEPADLRGLLGRGGAPTIGGAFATNSSGPRRVQAGAARDFLLGVRFVDGRGEILKNGGRVMKNVTGYDLVKLMAGAHGTLGVMSEVSFKVLPRAEFTGTLVWNDLDWAESLSVFQGAMNSPFDVTGAARLPGANGTSKTLVRLEGFETSVLYRLGQLQSRMPATPVDKLVTDAGESDALWKAVRDVAPFHDKAGAVWRSSVKPSDMLRVVDQVSGEHLLDWAGGLIWSMVDPAVDLRAALASVGGHSTLVRPGAGQDDVPRFEPQPAPLAALAAGLRAQFDPRGILNPGLMG
ncbi:FAD-binding protein [Epibacterium sp. SM1979]|uniref:FAD-binding protein n=1 Tax=Tritonibacter litoralis TaxID=2662264 RepID=A0A843YL56_9RHOB|nr:FAD-binding protein [Tritonibacter litoralis]MQQ10395.1 FAD-binding protein [Tritonibacter litoralis]